MQVVTGHPNGVFGWIDLSTSDTDGAKRFYGELFGWEPVTESTGQGTDYTMFKIDGYNVAGLVELPKEMLEQGVPPIWTSYIKHDDLEAITARITAAGGSVFMPPMDVMDEGRISLFMDPAGAAVGLWQPKNHIGVQVVNQPNTLIWNELQTRDRQAARAFFENVFGWECVEDKNGYLICKSGGQGHIGIMELDDNFPDIPPNWAVFFLVEDVPAAAARAESLGGKILVPPLAASDVGVFSVIADPQGGVFYIIKFNEGIDPVSGN